MDSKTIKESLTTDDIVRLCCALQDDDTVLYDSQQHPIFNTILDHKETASGNKWALYYYPETGLFHCYTGDGENYDIFTLVQRFLDLDFTGALRYIVDFFHLRGWGEEDETPEEHFEDWDLFQRARDLTTPIASTWHEDDPISENLLEYYYPLAAPTEWQAEGISPEVMRAYGIRVDSALHHIIIPHRNRDGKLIGIRRRSYNPFEVEAGKKYMPVIIQNDIYRHNLGANLYGLYENAGTIRSIGKVLVAESEKSVLQLASMYGIDQCWAVAVCGSSISPQQRRMLIDLGVNELVLGFDHEFTGGRGDADTKDYEQKLLRIVNPLIPFINVSVIMDYDGLTALKDAPTDRGREIFEKLYHQRVRLYTSYEEPKKRGKR